MYESYLVWSQVWVPFDFDFQDQQANAELAKIMGEFTDSGNQPTSACSKGDDLLAMMDGLWRGYPNRKVQGSCSTVTPPVGWTCKYAAVPRQRTSLSGYYW